LENRLHYLKDTAVLIAKLEWARLGESERQIRDASGVIEIQGTHLDIAYIEHWIAALNLDRQWEAARRAAGLTIS
jgi:hypothetical protein